MNHMNYATLVVTRHTDERFAIRQLIDVRPGGWSLLKGFFIRLTRTVEVLDPKTNKMIPAVVNEATQITDADLMAIYTGQPIEKAKWELVKRVLKERMPKET